MSIYDMLLANAMMGEGGGGGGGSSDFSTAQVTIKCPSGFTANALYSTRNDDGTWTCIFRYGDGFADNLYTGDGEPVTGTLYWDTDSAVVDAYVVTDIEGSAIYDAESRRLTITGDCTITGYVDD